jgi:hypothetical protein
MPEPLLAALPYVPETERDRPVGGYCPRLSPYLRAACHDGRRDKEEIQFRGHSPTAVARGACREHRERKPALPDPLAHFCRRKVEIPANDAQIGEVHLPGENVGQQLVGGALPAYMTINGNKLDNLTKLPSDLGATGTRLTVGARSLHRV